VQQELQRALSIILRREVEVVGAGRTDAGVHAKKMIAHFDWDGASFDPKDLVYKLNRFISKSISVSSIRQVKPDAHARFSAISRTYSYYVTTVKDPFLNELTHRIHFIPNLDLINQLCEILKEYTDFTSFSKLHTDVKTNNCVISYAHCDRVGDTMYVFTFTADRFLRNMVRAIVGTLLEAGRGRLDERGFRRIINAKNRCVAGESVPGNALYLVDVKYPDDIWL
jgi:tRNA pseudouridine38-40 synthase